MNIPPLFRRAKSRYADDKAVNDFERVARETGLLPAKSAFDVAMEQDQAEERAIWDMVDRIKDEKP